MNKIQGIKNKTSLLKYSSKMYSHYPQARKLKNLSETSPEKLFEVP